MNRFLAGNNMHKALEYCKKIKNKTPIINYISENNKNKDHIHKEYIKLIKNIKPKYQIALKLSSLNFDRILINNIVDECIKKDIKIIIDAEDNNNINKYRSICNELITNNNSDKCNIVKTYQMYRLDSFDELKYDITFMKKRDKFLGTKLVRGAYWNTENSLGNLFVKKEDTDNNYNKALFLCNKLDVKYNIVASHNKKSIELAISLNNQNLSNRFIIAHLMGMNEKYMKKIQDIADISVYIPYGPYIEAIPYLSRRLYENIDTVKYLIS